MEIPSNQDLLSILNSQDCLALTIRGHQSVETVLAVAISEVLPEPHAVELARLSFNFKVDLAIALRIIPLESRPCYLAVNRIRNQFAHNPAAQFTEKEAQDLYNILSPFQRYVIKRTPAELSNPQDILRNVIATMFMELKGAVNRLRDQKIENEVLHELVEEILADSPVLREDNNDVSEVRREIRERVENKKSSSITSKGGI